MGAAFFLILALGIGVLVVGGIAAYRARQRRIAELAALALRLNLRYTSDDPGNVLALPFALFDRGDGRSVADFLVGDHDGCPVQLFDYEYYDESESTDAQGMHQTSRSYSHLTCGLLTLPIAAPHLTISRENVLTRLASHLGLHDVELESNEFNRTFRVHCEDQRFAFSLIDGQMMEWMLHAAVATIAIEVNGPFVLLAIHRVPPDERTLLLEWFDQLRGHIPHVVFASYPPR
jgi:hypothetical protein